MFHLVYRFFSLAMISYMLHSNAWEITSQLNPECSLPHSNCSTYNIVYIRAENETLSSHFLISGTNHLTPSILAILSSNPKSILIVDWLKLNSTALPIDAISVSDVITSYAIVFNNLIEYNDTKDTIQLSSLIPTSLPILHPFSLLDWRLLTNIPDFKPHPIGSNESFELTYFTNQSSIGSDASSKPDLFGKHGRLELKFMVSPVEKHNPTLPRLEFVPGLTVQFEVGLVHLQSDFSRARFALDFLLISSDPLQPTQDYLMTTSTSINDELTPGIFQLINVKLNAHPSDKRHKVPITHYPPAYMQTRPVCYTEEKVRELKGSRNAIMGTSRLVLPDSDWRPALLHTLPYLFYGQRIADASQERVGLRVQNISFGTPEDGFYNASKYIVWTATFGFGEPPTESLSSLLIGLLSLSFVVVLGSVLFGAVLMFIFQRRRRFHTFQRLTESNPPSPRMAVHT